MRPGGCRVQAVLRNIEIQCAEVCRREIVKRPVYLMKRELTVPAAALRYKFFGANQHPLVDFSEVFRREQLSMGIEVVQVAKRPAEGIAELAVRFCETREDHVRYTNILDKIDRSHPEAEHVRPRLLY